MPRNPPRSPLGRRSKPTSNSHSDAGDPTLAPAAANSMHQAESASASGSVSSPAAASVSAPVYAHTQANANGAEASTDARIIKRRSAIACRRCRRMRTKCLHEKGKPPCYACNEAGIPASECIFPVRGQPDVDRDFRHPRLRSDKPNNSASSSKAKHHQAQVPDPLVARLQHRYQADSWDTMPPMDEIIDGVNRFTRQYFQLGFTLKKQYPERLRRDRHSTSLFLLLAILSISARLSPPLRLRYGGRVQAAEYFMERAGLVAEEEVYQEPTLERCQAFYLLSIAQQGSGLRNKSYINMGIAARMAVLMQLHREETYHIPKPTPELIMRAESARRTIWMLHSQDNLHSGPFSPVSLSASDMSVLLPCGEKDFSEGRCPKSRAALDGTLTAIDNPGLLRDPNRSLFATLIQLHHWWGIVGRRAVRYSKSSRPWEPTSDFSQMARKLRDWEDDLPRDHLWSPFLLKGYKADNLELAYLCVTMMTRLANIVLRRPYLTDIIKRDTKGADEKLFFTSMSSEIFSNVRQLYEQIDAQFTDRTPDESVGAQIAAFCIYSCGLFAAYLCKFPTNESLVRDGPMMHQRTLHLLKECRETWPLADRWVEALEKFSQDPRAVAFGSMDDGKDPVPKAIRLPPLNVGFDRANGNSVNTFPSLHNMTLHNATSDSKATPSSQGRIPLSATPPINSRHQQSISPSPTQGLHLATPPPSASPLPYPGAGHASHAYMQHANSAPAIAPRTGDGVGMLIKAFDSPSGVAPAIAAPPPAYGAGLPAASPAPYNQPLAPGTDGYEGELQFYIDGPPTGWMDSNNGWLDTMQ